MLLRKNYKFYAYDKNLTNWTDSRNSLSSSTIQKLIDGYRVYNHYMNFNMIKSLYFLICLSLNYLKKNSMVFFYAYLLLVTLLSLTFKKKGIFLNYSGDIHQSFSNKKNVPLAGGMFILIPLVFFLNDLLINCFIVSIYLIGYFSDRKILVSPKIRFLIQCILILLFVEIFEIKINSSRIELFDSILNYNIFAIFFSAFCLLILINGSNFIDGLNGILIFLTIIILLNLNKLDLIDNSIISSESVNLIILTLSLLLLLNIFNILMLRDSGAYLLGFFVGYMIISSHISNPNISPYFFISLIWYPCFENLFSILRKLNREFSP